MARILRASELPPPLERRLLVLLSALTSSSATMGLLAGPPVSALDTASVRRLLRAPQQRCIGGTGNAGGGAK